MTITKAFTRSLLSYSSLLSRSRSSQRSQSRLPPPVLAPSLHPSPVSRGASDMDSLCMGFKKLDVSDPYDEDMYMQYLDRRDFAPEVHIEFMDIDESMNFSQPPATPYEPCSPQPMSVDSSPVMPVLSPHPDQAIPFLQDPVLIETPEPAYIPSPNAVSPPLVPVIHSAGSADIIIISPSPYASSAHSFSDGISNLIPSNASSTSAIIPNISSPPARPFVTPSDILDYINAIPATTTNTDPFDMPTYDMPSPEQHQQQSPYPQVPSSPSAPSGDNINWLIEQFVDLE